MCDIEYEEFDNHENIYKDLKHMLVEGDSRYTNEVACEATQANLESVDRDRIYNKSKIDCSEMPNISELYSQYNEEYKEKIKEQVVGADKNDEIDDDDDEDDDDIASMKSLLLTDDEEEEEEEKSKLLMKTVEIGSTNDGDVCENLCLSNEKQSKYSHIGRISNPENSIKKWSQKQMVSTSSSSFCDENEKDDSKKEKTNNNLCDMGCFSNTDETVLNKGKKQMVSTCSSSFCDDNERDDSKKEKTNNNLCDMGCFSNTDETVLNKGKKQMVSTCSSSLCDENEKGESKSVRKAVNTFTRPRIYEIRRPTSNNVAISSLIVDNSVMVDNGNSDDDADDIDDNCAGKEIMAKSTAKSVSTGTSCDPPDGSGIIKKSQEFCTQADIVYHDFEEKILPFVRNVHTVELKLRGRTSLFQRACIKQIAEEHSLLMKVFGKGKDSYVLLRKKIKLLEEQKLFLEIKKAEKEKKEAKIKELKAKQERLLNPPKVVSSSCQVDFLESDDDDKNKKLSKNAKKRLKKKAVEKKQKQMLKCNSGSQTVPDGFYVCPYCESDIPESIQHIHYPFCVEKYRNNHKICFNNTNNNNNINTNRIVATHNQNISDKNRLSTSANNIKKRSKSTEKVKNQKLQKVKQELDKVHNNDINGIINAISEVDKSCSVAGCGKKKIKTCSDCALVFCVHHFDPNNDNAKQHLNCAAALEREELERQSRLGSNNPLLKTVQELRSPKFKDGSVVSRRQRKLMMQRQQQQKQQEQQQQQQQQQQEQQQVQPQQQQQQVQQQHVLSGDHMTYFERDRLQKRLRERISRLSEHRTK